jgi:threonine/homoserine/homoserine lactone efflux protein
MNFSIEAILAVVLGLVILLGAILNWQFILRPDRLVNRLMGPVVTRIVVFIIGLILLGLGIGLILGWIGL